MFLLSFPPLITLTSLEPFSFRRRLKKTENHSDVTLSLQSPSPSISAPSLSPSFPFLFYPSISHCLFSTPLLRHDAIGFFLLTKALCLNTWGNLAISGCAEQFNVHQQDRALSLHRTQPCHTATTSLQPKNGQKKNRTPQIWKSKTI